MRVELLGWAMRSVVASVSMAAAALGLTGTAAQAQIFQDNVIGYRYGTKFEEPGLSPVKGADVTKSILNYTHVDGYKWGSNFLSVDLLISDDTDPSVSGKGAQEVYIVYRHGLSYGKITGNKFKLGPIVDVGLNLGGDFNTKNTEFGSAKKLAVAGVYLAWGLPKGFLTTSFNYCQEWNQNGITNVSVHFDPNFCFEAAWAVPFQIGPANFKFTGFLNVVAPKGEDGFGAKTKTEVLTRPELLLDVGAFWGKPNFVEAGVGYEYWLNKFGNDHKHDSGALAHTPMAIAKMHF
jgi:hypothetical protein